MENGGNARVQAVEVEKARKRKTNFSVNEIAVITENVEMNLAIIQSKLMNNITNKKKNEVWEDITRAMNETKYTVPAGSM